MTLNLLKFSGLPKKKFLSRVHHLFLALVIFPFNLHSMQKWGRITIFKQAKVYYSFCLLTGCKGRGKKNFVIKTKFCK